MERKRAFKIIMSRGNPLQIDEDELPKLKQAIQTGQPAVFRQGIINPSFYVSVIEDNERLKQLGSVETLLTGETNEQGEQIATTRIIKEIAPLRDIFKDPNPRLIAINAPKKH